MYGFTRIRPQSMIVVYLSITVSAGFLFAAVDFIRSLDFETPRLITGAYYTAQGTITDCLATVPKIGRNPYYSGKSCR
jgi:hypothetical protein